MAKLLTKSKYLNGLQCPRLLWVAVNEPRRIPAPDATTQHVFDQGNLIGRMAQQLFPGGINVPWESFMGNISQTKVLLRRRQTIFEAGIMAGRLYARLDILKPSGNEAWDIVEVKSATSLKDENIDDIAFQKLACENSGLKIDKCCLVYINKDYVKHGEILPEEFFVMQDISAEVAAVEETTRDTVRQLLTLMDSNICPEPAVSPNCETPYPCALQPECWANVPENSVFTLYYAGKKAYELYDKDIRCITDIPPDYTLSDKQQIQFDCLSSGEPFIDTAKINDFLATLEYPLHYLDFETINPAVPLFDGTRPYQHLPFQYSLHIQPSPGASAQHSWYLAEGRQDPRPELLRQLRDSIGPEGSIIAYNKSFEERALREMAEVFPEYKEWVENVNSRMVDLIIPFRGFSYYHPAQKGSASLKKVLPAVTGKNYNELEIGEGGEASLRYLTVTFEDVPEEEQRQTYEALLTYCGLDTEGMVWIVDELRRLCQ